MGRQVQVRQRFFAFVTAGIFAIFAGACTLAPEQLGLPEGIAGSHSNSALATANRRDGVPLSDPANPETGGARVFEGTGLFTATPATDGAAPGRVQKSAGENGITLNLSGASVPEAAKAVLGDILQVNYTVSDKIKTTITLNTPRPVPKEDLLKLFETVLRSEGIALVAEGGMYRIVPAETVAGTGAPMRYGARGGEQAGTATETVALRYVSASEMERILKSVAPQVTIARADSARNMLLVTGSSAELASVRETVSTFDVDWMRGMSFALLPVDSSDPVAIAGELDKVFGNDGDGPSKGIVRFIPNTRLKSILVISSRPEYLRKAEGWLERIDMAGQATEQQVNVYHVQNRPVAELAALLQKVYTAQANGRTSGAAAQPVSAPAGDDSFTATANTLAVQGILPAARTGQAQAGAAPQPAAATPADSQAAAQAMQGDRTSGISIVPDETNNSLVITATAKEYKRIRQILARIDVAPNQVLLEATIAEVTLTNDLRFGLKWYFKQGANKYTLADTKDGTISANFPGFSYFLNTPKIQVALDALSSVTDVNVVSSPSMMVLDNKKAVLQIGDEVPIATQSAVSVATSGAPVVNSISFRNTGVILGITPRISDNGRVLLDIEQEVSDAVKTTTSSLDSPTIQQRRIRTSVAVADGESIVLAGMMKDSSTVTRAQVPLAGDIPVVGNLFKQKDDEIKRTELLIAITPHVVKDRQQTRAIAAEFRDRMNLTTRPQRRGPPDRRENVDRLVR